MTSSPIGIFDSGFGGLSIYNSIIKLLPHESTIYFGDHAYLPYGEKTKAQIRKRAKKLINFFISKHVKLIVVACNTATIAGIDQYRKWYPDIPIIGVVPVVKTAAEVSKRHAFAILSTMFTSRSVYQKQLIHKFASTSHVYNLGCSNLLSFVEKGILHSSMIMKELRSILTPKIIQRVDCIVLGCTHYPFLRDSIRAIVGKDMQLLDSGGAVARHVTRILLHNNIASHGPAGHEFYSTDPENKSNVASKLIGKKIIVQYAHI